MARSTMANPIKRLRLLTFAGSADSTVNAVTYWTDDQLQSELDLTQLYIPSMQLLPNPLLSSGSYLWLDYSIPVTSLLEENVIVRDSAGAVVSSSGYTINYDAKRITFTVDQLGVPRYADLTYYNVNRAAASVWQQKAGIVAANYDFQTDNHKLTASQEYEHCIKQAEKFAKLAGSTVGRFFRTDENLNPFSYWNGDLVQPTNIRPSRSLP